MTGCQVQNATVGQTLRHSLWIVNRKLKIVCFRWKIVTSKLWILGWQTGCHFQDATVGHALRHSLCKLTINGQIAFVQDTSNITLNVRNTAPINKNVVTFFFLSDIYFSLEVFTLINRALWFLEYQVREGSLLHIRYAGIGDTAYILFCHIRGMVLQFSFPKLDFDLKYFEIHV